MCSVWWLWFYGNINHSIKNRDLAYIGMHACTSNTTIIDAVRLYNLLRYALRALISKTPKLKCWHQFNNSENFSYSNNYYTTKNYSPLLPSANCSFHKTFYWRCLDEIAHNIVCILNVGFIYNLVENSPDWKFCQCETYHRCRIKQTRNRFSKWKA